MLLSTEIEIISTISEIAVGAGDVSGHPVARGKKNPLWYGMAYRMSRLRCAQDLTAQSVGLVAGLSHATSNAVEDEKVIPRIDTVERLAAALGVAPGWLAFGYDGAEPFQSRIKRPVVPLEDPEPEDRWRHYGARHADCSERLSQARARRGMSMRELARASGMSVQAISNTEAGKSIPKIDSVEVLALILDVAPAWLAYGDDPPLSDTRLPSPSL